MLSQRESEVLQLVSKGKTSKEVGKELYISENTVLKHMKSIHIKLDVKTRQHAVSRAYELHIL